MYSLCVIYSKQATHLRALRVTREDDGAETGLRSLCDGVQEMNKCTDLVRRVPVTHRHFERRRVWIVDCDALLRAPQTGNTPPPRRSLRRNFCKEREREGGLTNIIIIIIISL